MNVVVCIKQVPETPRIEIDAETGSLSTAEGKAIVNPFDMYALEEGIKTKERYGGKTTVISMGPSKAEEALREALALGVDEAILLSDPAFEGIRHSGHVLRPGQGNRQAGAARADNMRETDNGRRHGTGGTAASRVARYSLPILREQD